MIYLEWAGWSLFLVAGFFAIGLAWEFLLWLKHGKRPPRNSSCLWILVDENWSLKPHFWLRLISFWIGIYLFSLVINRELGRI